MSKNKKSSFLGKVNKDAKNQASKQNNYGVLNLPKGISIFTPEPDSRVRLDFIPYVVTDPKHPDRDEELDIATEDTLWYKRPFMVHRGVGADNDTVICLKSIGKKCPICEYRDKMLKDGSDKDDVKSLNPSKRNLYIVIPLDSKKHKKEIHIMDISQFLFQELLNKELDENPDNGIFPDLEEGLTLKVRFDSKQFGQGKPYGEASRIDFLDRSESYDESILDEVPNLDEMLKILTYDQLQAKFFEIDPDDMEDQPKQPREKENTRSKKQELEKEEVQWSWEQLENLSYRKLLKLAEDTSLDLDDYPDADSEDELRTDLAKELGVKVPKAPRQQEPEKEEPKRGMQRSTREPVREKKSVEKVEEEEDDHRPKTVAKGPSRNARKEEEDDQPKKSQRTSGGSGSSKEKEGCPSGYKFGKDLDKYDACDSCPVWDACLEASEKR